MLKPFGQPVKVDGIAQAKIHVSFPSDPTAFDPAPFVLCGSIGRASLRVHSVQAHVSRIGTFRRTIRLRARPPGARLWRSPRSEAGDSESRSLLLDATD